MSRPTLHLKGIPDPPEHGYEVNRDWCPLCGKSGLELMQEGNPPCTQEARKAFKQARIIAPQYGRRR
jgi:hypothetical protein